MGIRGGGPERLRRAVSQGTVVAPGCYDPFSVRAARSLGCTVAYLTPFGLQGSSYAGSLTWENVVETAAALHELGGIDLIVDLHTGLEGDLPLEELVAPAAQAGAAALVVEDRPAFGRHHAVLSVAEVGDKIRRVRAAGGASPLLVVRTDTVREDLREAVERSAAYLELGADLVMPLMTPYLGFPDDDPERRKAAYDALTARVDPRQIVVHSPHGRHLSLAAARATGFGVYLMPQLLVAGAWTGMRAALAETLDGTPGPELTVPIELADALDISSWLTARW